MSQNDYVDQAIKENGRRIDYSSKQLKKKLRTEKIEQKKSQKLFGLKAKIFAKKMKIKKIEKKKKILELTRQINKKKITSNKEDENKVNDVALPIILMNKEIGGDQLSKNIKSSDLKKELKEQRKTKTYKYELPVTKIQNVPESKIFTAMNTGSRKRASHKRLVMRPCFVPDDFTRNAPKFERFVRPTALRLKVAHVTNKNLGITAKLKILSVKRNPHGDLYSKLGVLSKGTIVEVDTSSLGLVTGTGKIEWARYAQIMNYPENDGYVNAVLLI